MAEAIAEGEHGDDEIDWGGRGREGSSEKNGTSLIILYYTLTPPL